MNHPGKKPCCSAMCTSKKTKPCSLKGSVVIQNKWYCGNHAKRQSKQQQQQHAEEEEDVIPSPVLKPLKLSMEKRRGIWYFVDAHGHMFDPYDVYHQKTNPRWLPLLELEKDIASEK